MPCVTSLASFLVQKMWSSELLRESNRKWGRSRTESIGPKDTTGLPSIFGTNHSLRILLHFQWLSRAHFSFFTIQKCFHQEDSISGIKLELESQSSLHGLQSTYESLRSASQFFNPPVKRKRPSYEYELSRYELWNFGWVTVVLRASVSPFVDGEW